MIENCSKDGLAFFGFPARRAVIDSKRSKILISLHLLFRGHAKSLRHYCITALANITGV
jgi:hypothetical protein